MGWGVRRAVEGTGIPTVTHDHDFWWERGDRYAPPPPEVRRIIDDCFPLALPNVRHAVINRAAQSTLRQRFGLDSVVVPNVMDFEGPAYGQPDDFNAGLRADLGVAADDLLLFQITRIVRRKGIETAIELVRRLGDPTVKLVITGTAHDDDPGGPYMAELQALVAQHGLDHRVIFAGHLFGNSRAHSPRVYSLSDAYAAATACTYFSTYEGFGNAFVECVLARTPIFVNRYEPVYWPDIGSKGFDAVMIRDGALTDDAVEAIRGVLSDPARQRAIAEHNFALGQRHFSYQALEALLAALF